MTSVDGLPSSVFVSDDAEVHDVPMSVIRRPIPSVLEEAKVQQFMRDIQAGDQLTPIEVLWIEEPPGSHYYFATGGCHRWEAHKRLNTPYIPARLIKAPASAISLFMGASSPFFKTQQEQQQHQADAQPQLQSAHQA